ncbi:MAG TPA: DUF6614 family protein [Casimicrobiaceae bacterium]
MDVYHIWCNLKPGVRDAEFVAGLRAYLDHLRERHHIVGYRITRAKLGFKPPQLREFHVTIDFEDLTQMQAAFDEVSTRADPLESLHHAVNAKVQDVYFALYRDFPDEKRVYGQEKF